MEKKQIKQVLRTAYKTKLQQIGNLDAQQYSELICNYALSLSALQQRKTVAAYASFDHEVNTDRLLAGLLARGFKLVLPVTDTQNRTMEFRSVENLQELTLSTYGICEPQHGPKCFSSEIELYFIPGLAFDRKGNRLGRGGGYYDRYLSAIRPDAVKVGLAYQLQIDNALPVETHDLQVDLLITETGVIPVNPD